MKTRHVAVVLLTVALGGAAAKAYVLNGPKWAVQQVPYYINPANSDMPEAHAIAAIQAGAMAWSAQSNANILPYYMGRTSGSTLSLNGKSEIFFRNTAPGGLYGETIWWYNGSYALIEADIVFYDGGVSFFGGNSGCSGGVYLEDATAHEFGHALGLGHSDLTGATMYPIMSWCSSSVRSLDPDDLAGIERLYPASGTNTAPSVTISSPSSGSTFEQGAQVAFSGSASDREDGSLSSSIVWNSNVDGQIGTGSSFGRVLSAGTHTITAKVTDSRGAVAESQRTVTVQASGGTPPPPPSSGLTLDGRGYKVKGAKKVDLWWSGSTAALLDVYRNGARITITANDGAYTDPINTKGGGSYTYYVCEASTSTCSAPKTVTF